MTTLIAPSTFAAPHPSPPVVMDLLSHAAHAGVATVAEVVGIVTDHGYGWSARTFSGAHDSQVHVCRSGRWSGLRKSVAQWLEGLEGDVIVVRCATEALRNVVAEAVQLPRFIVPSITALNSSLGWMACAVSELHDRIHKAARAHPVESVLYAATDGSAHPRYGNAAWSWVTHDGAFRTRSTTGNVMNAELGAIINFVASRARSSCGPDKRYSKTVLFSDSMQAVRALLTEDRAALSHFPSKQVAVAMHLLRSRMVEVVWVRSHRGHPLNDVADRLALLQHRQAWLRLSNSDVRTFAETIVDGILPTLAATDWAQVRKDAHREWREHDQLHPNAAVAR